MSSSSPDDGIDIMNSLRHYLGLLLAVTVLLAWLTLEAITGASFSPELRSVLSMMIGGLTWAHMASNQAPPFNTPQVQPSAGGHLDQLESPQQPTVLVLRGNEPFSSRALQGQSVSAPKALKAAKGPTS